jgi:preprotein translocase subunit SecA
MALLDAWKRLSLDAQGQPVKHIWDEFALKEKQAYAQIIKEKTVKIEGTVAELAVKLRLSTTHMAAFLDGIREAVDGVEPEMLEETTQISFDIDFARLYKQMVAYKAQDLYTLEEWNEIFTQEEQKHFYTEQKKSHTVVRNDPKLGRNAPCACGSGKKFKVCCGAA